MQYKESDSGLTQLSIAESVKYLNQIKNIHNNAYRSKMLRGIYIVQTYVCLNDKYTS